MTVSEYIFGFLQKKGCETVYMVSGSSAVPEAFPVYASRQSAQGRLM